MAKAVREGSSYELISEGRREVSKLEAGRLYFGCKIPQVPQVPWPERTRHLQEPKEWMGCLKLGEEGERG